MGMLIGCNVGPAGRGRRALNCGARHLTSDMSNIEVIFFDIGNTLAVARVNSAGRFASLEPLPGAIDALRRFKQAGYRLGIISNTGDETSAALQKVLTAAGLY
jgi:FMN phosphatase YigB (HAD superfamily)